jgi:hypothetical protein
MTDDRRYREAAEYLADATALLQERGMSVSEVLITVLYEASCWVNEYASRVTPEEQVEIRDAVEALSRSCAETLVPAPRRGPHLN